LLPCGQASDDSTSKEPVQTTPSTDDAYQAQVDQQQREQQQDQTGSHLTVDNDNSYRRVVRDSSIRAISMLFNAGHERTTR